MGFAGVKKKELFSLLNFASSLGGPMPAPLLPVPSGHGGDITMVQMVALAAISLCSLAEDSVVCGEVKLCHVSVDMGRDSDVTSSTYFYIKYLTL